MNINISKPSKNYVPFAATPIKDKEATSTAVDVPWGYYLASKNRRILTRVMTTSINSCIAYLFWDKDSNNFLFAHISTDGEACSAVSLVKELTGETYSENALFVCVTGMGPSDATTTRIKHIVSNLDRPHRYFNTPCGGVTIDLSQESIIQSKGPVAENVKISKEEKSNAMKKENKLPLNPIALSNSWVGTGTVVCPPIKVVRGRSGSLDKVPFY
ncbi:MAG TPA: hypothetical protein VM553_16180 [Dongiaceae bacterium]|nr:hypothetical protein [Dongiaceae bacterium]